VLAGCGGSEQATTGFTEPPPLTKAEFLAEADRICFAIESEIEASLDDFVNDDDPNPAEVRRVVDRIVVPRLRSEVETIRLLDPPPADRAEVERILAATERGTDQLEADPMAATDRVPSGLRTGERLARAYGSEQCGIR
jgi:integrase